MPHAKEAAARLAADGERLRQEVVLGLACLETGAEIRRLLAKRLVRQIAETGEVAVDLLDERPHALDIALVLGPEDA